MHIIPNHPLSPPHTIPPSLFHPHSLVSPLHLTLYTFLHVSTCSLRLSHNPPITISHLSTYCRHTPTVPNPLYPSSPITHYHHLPPSRLHSSTLTLSTLLSLSLSPPFYHHILSITQSSHHNLPLLPSPSHHTHHPKSPTIPTSHHHFFIATPYLASLSSPSPVS